MEVKIQPTISVVMVVSDQNALFIFFPNSHKFEKHRNKSKPVRGWMPILVGLDEFALFFTHKASTSMVFLHKLFKLI